MQTAKAYYGLCFGQGEIMKSLCQAEPKDLELSQEPSRKHVLGDISFGFHYKAASMSLEAPVSVTGRWCSMVQALNLSRHKHVHHQGRAVGKGGC